jgi:hypothetical protein
MIPPRLKPVLDAEAEAATVVEATDPDVVFSALIVCGFLTEDCILEKKLDALAVPGTEAFGFGAAEVDEAVADDLEPIVVRGFFTAADAVVVDDLDGNIDIETACLFAEGTARISALERIRLTPEVTSAGLDSALGLPSVFFEVILDAELGFASRIAFDDVAGFESSVGRDFVSAYFAFTPIAFDFAGFELTEAAASTGVAFPEVESLFALALEALSVMDFTMALISSLPRFVKTASTFVSFVNSRTSVVRFVI